MSEKIVHIAAIPDTLTAEGYEKLYALTSSGNVYKLVQRTGGGRSWKKLPPLPPENSDD